MPARRYSPRYLAFLFAGYFVVGIYFRGFAFFTAGLALGFTLFYPNVFRLLRWLPPGYFDGPGQRQLPDWLAAGWAGLYLGALNWDIWPDGLVFGASGTAMLALCAVHIAVARRRSRNPASVQRHIVDLS